MRFHCSDLILLLALCLVCSGSCAVHDVMAVGGAAGQSEALWRSPRRLFWDAIAPNVVAGGARLNPRFLGQLGPQLQATAVTAGTQGVHDKVVTPQTMTKLYQHVQTFQPGQRWGCYGKYCL